MKFAYFPGCALQSSAKNYDYTARAVARRLEIELWEIPDWNCCGALTAQQNDYLLPFALAARNLLKAEKEGLDVAVPCSICYKQLAAARFRLAEDETLRGKINEIIGRNYNAANKPYTFLESIIKGAGIKAIKNAVAKPLTGLKIVCYYGCSTVRLYPQSLNNENPENPMMMDQVMEAMGAEVLPWAAKTECCGAGHYMAKPEIINKLGNDIISLAEAANANCIVTGCPLCQNNLEMRQGEMSKIYNVKHSMPVFFFTELMALAYGLSAKEIGFKNHFVSVLPLLDEKRLV